MQNTEKSMSKIVELCKGRGFIFPGSDIYGGLANTWDYGPLGARLKNNVKDTWRKRFIQERRNSYEVDADILMHPRVWEASGHVASFSDPLLDCRECKTRHRADNLIDDFDPDAHADGMTKEEMFQYIKDHHIPCPKCGKHDFTDIREFNLMFQTYRGVTNDSKSIIYLRPENAQGEYVNFLNVQRTMRAKLPFSIGQIGKAFRNEITPGNFTFRTIEFEQMEFQTFCKEGTDGELYEYFKGFGKKYFEDLGLAPDHLRFHDHEKLAHYAKAACDIEFLSRSAGERSTAPTTAPISTLPAIRNIPAQISPISIPRPTRGISPTSSNPPTASTERFWRFCAKPTTRRSSTPRKTTSERFCISAPPSRPTSARCCPFQRSSRRAPSRFTTSFPPA